jgi:hypothetical protein
MIASEPTEAIPIEARGEALSRAKPDRALICEKVLDVLKAHTDISLATLLETIAGVAEEGDIKAVISAMLAEDKIDMTPTRKIRLGPESAGLGECHSSARLELVKINQGKSAAAGA